MTATASLPNHVDVLIVGAGLSGIGAAYHVMRGCPDRSTAIIEGRARMGGTWDLFRYPGIRSDSDMPTLGYTFRPWTGERSIADGPSILRYIEETATEFGIDRHIHYRTRLTHADWRTEDARWHVTLDTPEGERRITCGFLFAGTGYYDYAAGHRPHFEGEERFGGRIVHPQHWPDDLDWTSKRVVVIGSGATAVTLVPEMARQAAHVTMLQRSPTWIAAMPSRDALADRLRRWFGDRAGHRLTRWKNIGLGMAFFQAAQRMPGAIGRLMLKGAAKALPEGFDVAQHLTPSYKPWDQRLCLVPDGDLFAAVKEERATIVTDQIEHFDERGIVLASGERIDADIVVAATGLRVQILGGATASVDGEPVAMGRTYSYKGAMYSGVPNFAVALGYTNASWTLKSELIARYVVRLLNHMEAKGYSYAVPLTPGPEMGDRTIFELSSGYLERARDIIPRQTERGPWRQHQNYLRDVALLRLGGVADQMAFGRAGDPDAIKRSAPRTEPRVREAA